jgi:hypothetical protein
MCKTTLLSRQHFFNVEGGKRYLKTIILCWFPKWRLFLGENAPPPRKKNIYFNLNPICFVIKFFFWVFQDKQFSSPKDYLSYFKYKTDLGPFFKWRKNLGKCISLNSLRYLSQWQTARSIVIFNNQSQSLISCANHLLFCIPSYNTIPNAVQKYCAHFRAFTIEKFK